MKVAFVLYHFPVLSQTFVLNQITGLIDRGHEVSIYAKTPGRTAVSHDDVQKYGLLDRTHYYGTASERLPASKLVRVIKAVGILARNPHRRPGPLLKALNVLKYGRMASSLGIFYDVVPFLEANRYDIVHCHFGPNGNLAALLKELGAIRGKIVTAFHGEAGYTGEKRYLKGYDLVFRVGDLMLPMSERERQNLIELGCSPDKIVVHRMGVDLNRFAFAPRQPRGNEPVRLLTVGRLVEKKGVEYGIRAVAKVLGRYSHIDYSIIGDGPLRGELSELIASLGLDDRVRILGSKRQEEVAQHMREADVLLAPSVSSADGDQEGIPVVLMEAMAQGLLVLSTYHSGIPELVRDGESGFLVPERDVDALAERLEYLVTHQGIWPEMGRAGRDQVERHHNIDRLNDELVDLYGQLVDGECA